MKAFSFINVNQDKVKKRREEKINILGMGVNLVYLKFDLVEFIKTS
jgi:hypothetical protein